jgi:hypothetical protein
MPIFFILINLIIISWIFVRKVFLPTFQKGPVLLIKKLFLFLSIGSYDPGLKFLYDFLSRLLFTPFRLASAIRGFPVLGF